ncbi:restriction endonuclease [Spirochaetia bacterium]|nr:restriction endonuclease [Spirochaetia bacterium]
MSIPTFQMVMLPLLKFCADNPQEHRMDELTDVIIKHFKLTDEERRQLLPSGKQEIIDNRVGWARSHLKIAGLLEDPKRGYVKITQLGSDTIAKNPADINMNFLNQFEKYKEYYINRRKNVDIKDNAIEKEVEENPPLEMIETGIEILNNDLAEKLLEKINNNSPAFFEKIVLDLLQNMGYGRGNVTGKSGDEGIDGFVNQDTLGLEKIYFQAKRFTGDTRVTASMVRDFVGSLAIKNVKKGVFITSTDFPKDAEQQLQSQNIVLINRQKLLSLMIKYNIGVSLEKNYEIKKLDSDYFPED